MAPAVAPLHLPCSRLPAEPARSGLPAISPLPVSTHWPPHAMPRAARQPPELSPDFVLHCLIGTSTRAAVLRPLGSRATAVQQRCPHLHPLQLLLLFSGKERRLRALMWPHLPLISLIWRAYSSLRRSERRRVPQRLARLLASHPFDESPSLCIHIGTDLLGEVEVTVHEA